jgi:hypothetical protein
VFFSVDSVTVSLAVEPELQPTHRVEVLLNGSVYQGWPAQALSHTLSGLYRGSYTLAVRIVDANDRVLCTGQVTNFHVRQPSVLAPQNPLRPQPKK